MTVKRLTLKNDFGEIEITDRMMTGIESIIEGAWQLQMTPYELLHILLESDMECPCCKEETMQ